MHKIDLVITFDTEDVFTPAELGWDDVLKNYSDILSSEDVPAHFILIGRRAALLKERGRQDIIQAMKRQLIGVHNLADDSPREFVVAAQSDWNEGLDEVRKMEHEAYHLVADAFDCRPVCLSGHYYSGAAQSFIAAKELNLPYVYGYPTMGPMYSISRFCGAMNLPWGFPTNFAASPYFGGFDSAVADVNEFEKKLEEFEQRIQSLNELRQPFLLFHAFHPVKTYSPEWIANVVVPDGRTNSPDTYRQLRQLPLRNPSEMGSIYRNFRRLLQFIKRHPLLNVTTIPEIVEKYSITPDSFSAVDLCAASQRIVVEEDIVAEKPFSPAETLVGLAMSLKAWKEGTHLPESVPRVDVLGPMRDPLCIYQEAQALPSEAIFDLAGQVVEFVEIHGHLPDNLGVCDGGELGLGIAYRAFAEMYRCTYLNGQPPASVNLRITLKQPSIGHEIACQYLEITAQYPYNPPNLDTGWLYQSTRLQSWTLASLV